MSGETRWARIGRVAGWLVAMLFLACMAAAALWIGFAADPADIRGGLPFPSPGMNTRLGRLAFVAGGLTCLALLVWGLRLGPQRQHLD